MAGAEHVNRAKAYLAKAEEYLASADDEGRGIPRFRRRQRQGERYTPAAGDAIHAGISAKDAIVTVLTGTTGKPRTTRQQPRSCA